MVVKEIEYWRRSKLLPDQYCDFLLNLYVDPDEEQSAQRYPSSQVGKAVAVIQKATGKQWLITIGTFTLISFVMLYFSRFHLILQIAIIIGGVSACLWLGSKLRQRNEATGLSLTSIGMLLLLGGGLYMIEQQGLHQWGWKVAFIGFCSLFWIAYGIRKQIQILHLCGWLAAVLVYGWLLSRVAEDAPWYEVQLFWLPFSFLFAWSSWFVHRWAKPVSAILFTIGATMWFMPEIYTLVIVSDVSWLQIQMQLLAKIALGGILLFSLRKRWMVRVA